MTTELAIPACSMVWSRSVNCLGGNPMVSNWYSLEPPGLEASMKPRISLTVWWLLNLDTRRVPSANLSWIEVTGTAGSTTSPLDGAGAVFVCACGACGSELVPDPLAPKVLPTPWNGVLGFGGSCDKWKKSPWQCGLDRIKHGSKRAYAREWDLLCNSLHASRDRHEHGSSYLLVQVHEGTLTLQCSAERQDM